MGPGLDTQVSGGFFHGYALNAVDAKHRLSIPASYRETIEARSHTRAVVLAPHESAPCLIGYDPAHSALLQAQIEQRFAGDFGDARDAAARLAFGATELLPYDDNGRVVLSPMLKELGGLDRLGFFLALGTHFELWNPEALLAAPALDSRIDRIVRKLLADRGGK